MKSIPSDAIHYWEPRRVWYNFILALIFIGWIVLTWPHFSQAPTSEGIVFLVFYFVMANLSYSAVYIIDVPMQYSPLRGMWVRWRFGLWLLGMVLTLVFTNYWIADEIYPFVH